MSLAFQIARERGMGYRIPRDFPDPCSRECESILIQQKVDVNKLVNESFAQEAVPPGVEDRTLRQVAFVLKYMHQSINESNVFCKSPLSGS